MKIPLFLAFFMWLSLSYDFSQKFLKLKYYSKKACYSLKKSQVDNDTPLNLKYSEVKKTEIRDPLWSRLRDKPIPTDEELDILLKKLALYLEENSARASEYATDEEAAKFYAILDRED